MKAIAVKMAWKMAYDNVKKNVNITIILSFYVVEHFGCQAVNTAFLTYKYTKKTWNMQI